MRVSAELIEFSDSINPSKGYISKGTELVEDVYTKLKGVHNSGTLSRFKVDRESYGGSVGKKTSVIYPDFDCVVFLNNVKPPLTTFLKELKSF
ncbi:Large proline-rich protein bag6-B [Orchesella cincta]|uniref:Large proline-rich protein bag6-B n=1 Tax=Orchesella cincta TaxID=48709 RepID=A0A1D2M5L3_ORCCI|nr:Large proline-rich protein bag6-B [Orchesella cincta]